MEDDKTSLRTEWRDEVSSHVERYRERRRKFNSNLCLQLDFEAQRRANRTLLASDIAHSEAIPEPAIAQAALEVADLTNDDAAPLSASEQRGVEPPAPVEAEKPAPQRRRKIIEFPRLVAPLRPQRDELAEPMVDSPRIFEEAGEAPADIQTELQCELLPVVPAITLEQLRDELREQEEPRHRVQPASLKRRAWAAALDAILLGAALGIFGFIFVRLAHGLPTLRSRAVLIAVTATAAMFWAAYHCAFLIWGRATAGMRLTGLEIRTFHGGPLQRALLRRRALALVLSCASAGLGVWWALLDDEALGWHDRISRTYVARR